MTNYHSVKNFDGEKNFGESPQFTKLFLPIFPMKHGVPVVVMQFVSV